MVDLRHDRIEKIAESYAPTEVVGDPDGEVLVVGWGSTWGAITGAVGRLRRVGRRVGHVHLRNLHPLPNDLGEILGRYEHVFVPEMNLGQLTALLRAEYLVDAKVIAKVMGQPFTAGELVSRIEEMTR
jgi:2-oxoglutarate ferredoxin oxidoreductase subunit alpha